MTYVPNAMDDKDAPELDGQNEDCTRGLKLNWWTEYVNSMLNNNIGQTPGDDTSGSGETDVSEMVIQGIIMIITLVA